VNRHNAGWGKGSFVVGLLQDATGQTITFMEWTIAMLPLVLVLFAFCYWLRRASILSTSIRLHADAAIDEQIRECGRLLMEEKFLGLLIVGAIGAGSSSERNWVWLRFRFLR
jgi:di/tricarboxylate transporter